MLRRVERREARALVFGSRVGPFSGWSKAKASLDARVSASLGGALAPWRLHDIRRTVATRLADIGVLPHADVKAARERLTPLDGRLARLLATIPIEVQREGPPLAAMQASLRGRTRGSCHPGELGAALRRAGFVRQRNWRGVDGFRAIWRRVA
jgi:hypothetical protein